MAVASRTRRTFVRASREDLEAFAALKKLVDGEDVAEIEEFDGRLTGCQRSE